MGTKTTYTLADYMALPEGAPYELSEGELVMSPSPTFLHNKLRDLISVSLRYWLDQHPAGEITSETDFQLATDTVRRPDIAFVRAERFAPEYERQVPIPVAPDLVFEIVSPGDRPSELQDKVDQYLKAGAARVWLLYPDAAEALLHTSVAGRPEIRQAARGQILDAPELLPGWMLQLAHILK